MKRWQIAGCSLVSIVAAGGIIAGRVLAEESTKGQTNGAGQSTAAGASESKEPSETTKEPAGKTPANPLKSFISSIFNAAPESADEEGELEFLVDEESETIVGDELPEGAEVLLAAPGRNTNREAERATHRQSHQVVMRGLSYKTLTLKTFCLLPEGQIVGALGPAQNYGIGGKTGTRHVGEIQIVTPDGQKVRDWTIPFEPQAINCSPDGTIFVAGDGKLAKYTPEGQEIAVIEAPHLAALLGDPEKLKEQAAAQLKAEQESYRTMAEDFEQQLREVEEKDPAERTKSEKRRLTQLKSMVKTYRQMAKMSERRTVESVVDELTTRLRTINSLAVSDEDVFYTCNETKGYGYAAWRTTRDFTEPKQIISGLSGCCGQMDIQCCDDELFVAENSRHRVIRYDRDGQQLATFGNKGQPKAAGFGGCCNPMNLRITPAGEVITAESEGYVKRFTSTEQFVELLGVAKVSGGCKNVAVASSSDGSHLFFYDQQGSRVVVLEQKPVEVSAETTGAGGS